MNRRHFLLWMGSVGLSAVAGTLLDKPGSTIAATLPNVARRRMADASGPAQKLSLIYDRDCLLYEGPPVGTVVESPTRLSAIVERLTQTGFDVTSHAVKPASYEQIARVHTPSYIKYIQKSAVLPQDEFAFIRRVETRYVNRPTPSPSGSPTSAPSSVPYLEHVVRYVKMPGDAPRFTKIRPYEAASLAAGGAVQAVDEVMKGQARYSFALLRPPGHHATRHRNMGFCVFNSAAVAARHAQHAYGLKRILILDWDVHHGNGTQEIFYTDPSVLYFSTHQENIYPKRTGKIWEVGAATGKGFNMNVPLPPYTGDDGFVTVFKELLVPVARDFKPDMIIVSAGQDAHEHEFVAQLRVTDEGYAQLTRIVKQLARELCDNKLVFVLEGGYNPRVTARAVEVICRELNGPENKDTLASIKAEGLLSPALQSRITQVKQTHLAYWPGLG